MYCKNISMIKKEECCGCSACMAICPKNAINMESDGEGFLYPKVNDKCIECGMCLKVCRNKTAMCQKEDMKKNAYAVKNKNENHLKKSSSGGISKALCDYFIKNNGVVYGVIYNNENEVIIHRETTIDGIEKFYGSKYVWANPKDTYREVYNDLKNEKMVLFISTSCFIAGLKSFLNMKRCNYDKLYTIDLICHGTPSPRLFKDYIEYLKKKYDFEKFEFRTKKHAWGYGSKNFGCTIYQNNGKDITDTLDTKLYLKLFFSNYALRPHCHNCEFATVNKPADITIADYWGLKEVHPDFFDERGVSAVIIHSEKGDRLFHELDSIDYIESTIDNIIIKQPNLSKPSSKKEDRDDFWNLYYKKGFKAVCIKYANYNFKSKLKNKIKNIKASIIKE